MWGGGDKHILLQNSKLVLPFLVCIFENTSNTQVGAHVPGQKAGPGVRGHFLVTVGNILVIV